MWERSHCSTFFTALLLLICSIFANIESMKLHFIVILICIFPVANELTYIFIKFLGHAWFLENDCLCLLPVFPLNSFFYWFIGVLYIVLVLTFFKIWLYNVANVFLQNMAYLSALFLLFSSEWEFIYMCVLCLEIIQICFFLIFTSLYLHFS